MSERYQLPDGKYINVDKGFAGSQDEKDFLNEINSQNTQPTDTSNQTSQTQSTNVAPTTKATVPQDVNNVAGVTDVTVTKGKENNWLYDTVIVAPYEGSRKFINATGGFIEGLGDTLGEATSIGMLAYGNSAKNGILEYVPYEEAKARGLSDPLFGKYDKKDFYNGGIKGFFYDPAHPENDNHTTSLVGSLAETVVQFGLSFVGAGNVLKIFNPVTATTFAQKTVQGATQGAIAQFVGFDENSGRLADTISKYSPEFGDKYLSYLQTKADDSWAEGRLKNSLEGMGIGILADFALVGIRYGKSVTQGLKDTAQATQDLATITKSQEAIIGVKDQLDQAKTIGEKMKIVNQALEGVDGLQKVKTKITPLEQEAFIQKLAKEDLQVNYDKWKAGELSAEEAFSIPRAWLNLDRVNPEIANKEFVNTAVSLYDAVRKSFTVVDKKFSDEVIKKKAIAEYGGDINKVYTEFSNATKFFKDTELSPLIYAHEMTLQSLINMIPAMVRQSKMGAVATDEIDKLLAITSNMMVNKKLVSSELGGALNTVGKTKQEIVKSLTIKENFERAILEFENFGKSNPEGKAKLLDKLATLDQPSISRQILNYIGSNRTWDVLNEVWINALLSSPKTWGVNAVGNSITAFMKPLEDRLGSSISAFLDNGNLSKKAVYELQINEAKATFAGLTSYLKDATRYSLQALKNGENVLETTTKFDTGKIIPKKFGGDIMRTPMRVLNATDEFFKQINYRAKLNALAVSTGEGKGLKGQELDDFIKEYVKQGFDETGLRGVNAEALKYAQEATYTNELTGFSKKFQEAINTYPIFKQIFPFVRTPLNLAKSVADRTVGGLTYNAEHLLGVSNDPKMIAKVRGQTAMGGILLSSATLMSELGMLSSSTNQNAGSITGKGDGKSLNRFTDAELLKLKKSETNFKQYSINIGDVQIPFGQLDPYGAFFGIIADYSTHKNRLTQEAIDKIGADMTLFLSGQMDSNPIPIADRIGIAVSAGKNALVGNTLSKTYFKGVQDIIDAMMSEDPKSASKYFQDKAGSFVPSIYTKIINDPYLRSARSTLDKVINERLGIGTPPSPQYNFFGEPLKKGDEDDAQRIFNNLLNPIPVGTKTNDVLTNEVLRLGKLPEKIKEFQDGVDYTQYKFGKDTAYDRLNQILRTTKIEGLTLKEKLTQDVQSDFYKSKTDPIKIAQGIADSGSKYEYINMRYEQYKARAEAVFQSEMGKYAHTDNADRNLREDIKKQNNNATTIKSGNRNPNSLQPLINFYQQ